MTEIEVRSVAPEEQEWVTFLITAGFIVDPVVRWLWPEAATYLTTMPRFVKAFGGRSFEHGSAYATGDQKAAALWLPPGVTPDEDAMMALIQPSVPADRLDSVASVMEQMESYHPKDADCWYLPLIATDPNWVGNGHGSALLAHALKRCDEDDAAAYLESSNLRNVSLYKRFGFAIMGEVQAGSSPVLYPMLRQPKSKVAP